MHTYYCRYMYILILWQLCTVLTSLITLHNQRENTRRAKLIIHMSGNQTSIMDPSVMDRGGEPKKFSFDYSYWSHDGFQEKENGYLEPTSPKYADQVRSVNYRDIISVK